MLCRVEVVKCEAARKQLSVPNWKFLSQVIRKYPKRSMDDFIGDENYAAQDLRALNIFTAPGYGDIKKTLRSLYIGHGSLDLPKVNSLCIAGPRKCGKKFLVEALCDEMGAVMFDLSPKVVKPIPIDEMNEFLSFVMQMAKKLQPCVILIDGAHKPFIKKMTPEEAKEEPKKLAKFLQKKVVKKLTKEDAIMLMGTTNDPGNCNFGQLRKCFEKIISFPAKLDYGTALMAWNRGLYSKKIYDFNASSLAKITRDYSIGDILEIIDCHLNLRRRMK